MTKPDDPQEQQDSPRRSYDTTLLVALLLFVLTCCHLFIYWYQEDRHKVRLPADTLYAPATLITYRETNVFTCPVVGEPTCFVVREDSTFIIGTDTPPALWFFDDTGTPLRKIDLPEEPRAIACGTSETLFADRIVIVYSAHIAVYTAEGVAETSWKLPGERSNVRSIVLSPDCLFAADTLGRCVYRFDSDGKLDLTFGEFVVYASPMVMTYSPHTDLLYVTNPGKHRVDVFTQDGEHKPESSWGEPSSHYFGFAGCCNPIGLLALDDGYILTVEKAVSRIKIFRMTGSIRLGIHYFFDCIVAGPGVLDALPPGVARRAPLTPDRYFAAGVLSEGRIAVFDFEYAVVRIFVPVYIAHD